MEDKKWGVTLNGFKRKTYYDLLDEIHNDIKEALGEEVNLSSNSLLGRWADEKAWRESEFWEELEDAYYSAFVSTAEGVSLDYRVNEVTGGRKLAQKARGIQTFEGRPATKIGSGFKVSDENFETVFQTMNNAIIPKSGVVDIPVVALVAGSAGNVGPGVINTIVNPYPGVTKTYNKLDLDQGVDAESDDSLKDRFVRSYARGGSTTRAAIQSALLSMPEVDDAFVRENITMEVDEDGLPPKSVSPVVFGGEDEDVAQTILKAKAGGIQSYGNVVVDTIDSKGVPQKIGFVRPNIVTIYVLIKLKRADGYPGDDEVINSVIAYIGGTDTEGIKNPGLGLGETVVVNKILGRIMCNSGIEDIEILIGKSKEDLAPFNIEVDKLDIANTSIDRVEIEYV